ncbi:MAG: Ig-like domain-containing protein [Gemmatimonadota bacterium]
MKGPGRGILWLLGIAVGACGGGGGTSPDHTPSQVLVSAGDNQVGPAGQELAAPLEVTVKDASGSPLSGITVAWATASGGGTVTPSSTTTADGKATATRRLGPGAGAQTTTATVSGVAPATFHHVAQIQGATQIAANSPVTRTDSVLSTASYSAVVRDQNSNVVAGVIVAWSVTGGGGVLSQLVDTTDVNGITSTNLTLDQTAAPRSVQATVTGLQGSPVTFVENGVAGNATQATRNSPDPQVGAVSSPLPIPLSVLVKDAYNNPKPGTSVTWKLEGLGAPPPSTTDASGIAVLNRTLGASPGAYHDTAAVTGLPGTIAFTDTAVAVSQIDVGSGGNVFSPAAATVPKGNFVRFTWAGGVTHNVHWDTAPGNLPPNSPDQSSGTFLVRLVDGGSYGYHCTFHGSPTTGMHGTITVN